MSMDPLFTVVICTYNRATTVGRAVSSVLRQTWCDFQLIVVDDGSDDETPSALAKFEDPRLLVVRRENGGLSAARNTGIKVAAGHFVAFLDDDDEVAPRWLEAFASAATAGTGFISCTCRMVSPDGSIEGFEQAVPHALFPEVRGVFMAGTFAVDRSILVAIGGYAEQIRVNHQTELLLRVLPELDRRGMTAALVDEPLVTIEQREHRYRPIRHPRALLQGTEYLIENHGARLEGSAPTLANYHAVAGVSAAQLGEHARARRHFRRAIQLDPTRPRHAARLAVSLIPPLARHLWRNPQGR